MKKDEVFMIRLNNKYLGRTKTLSEAIKIRNEFKKTNG